MAAKKAQSQTAKKKAQPPASSGSGKPMPPWMAQAAKKAAAPKRTPRKAGGK